VYEEMHKIGVSINQIAKKVNMTGELEPEKMEELKGLVEKLRDLVRDFSVK
jgi:hypothetical protein